MRHFKKIFVILLVAILSLSIVACGDETVDPTVTITGENATISVGDVYTLEYTADADSVTVNVSEASGKTTYTFDKENGKFTATEAGVYTIEVVATRGDKTAKKSLVLTVTEKSADENLPTVTIIGEDTTIYVGSSYTLEYTAVADSVTVNVSEASGKTTYTFDKENSEFVATEAGVYTLEVVATRGDKTAKKSLVLTALENAPVITLSTDVKKYTVAVGEELTLPTATAVDNVDGEIEVFVSSLTGSQFCSLKNGVFVGYSAGVHEVVYYAENAAANSAMEIVEVTVTPTTAESYDVTGYNDITVLANETLESRVFRENFEKMNNAPLTKRALFKHTEMVADERAISGNSILIDYGALVGNDNRWFISNLSPYMTGMIRLTMNFDVKLVSGVGMDRLYVGYGKNGETSSTDISFSLSDMAVGGIKRITYSQTMDFTDDGSYFLHIFELTRTMENCVLAFDNFEIIMEKLDVVPYDPDLNELKSGVVFDWNDTYMNITSGNHMAIADVPDEDAKAAMTGEGWGENVMYLDGNGSFILNSLQLARNPDIYPLGYAYVITFNYYKVKVGGDLCFIAFDGTEGNAAITSSFFNATSGKVTIAAPIKSGWYKMCFYCSGDLKAYIGDMSVQLVPWREDLHDVTQEEMLASGGYTFDYAVNNAFSISDSLYTNISTLPDETMKAAMTEANGFSNDFAIYVNLTTSKNTSYLSSLTGKLDPANDYTISVNVYEVGSVGEVLVLPMNQGGNQNGLHRFTRTNISGNLYNYTLTFNPLATDHSLLLYNQGAGVELYFGDFNVSAVEHVSATTTPKGYAVGKTWEISPSQFYGTGDNGGVLVDTPAAYVGMTGFTDKVMKYDIASLPASGLFNVYRLGGGNVFESCGTYKVTVYYALENTNPGNNYICFDSVTFDAFAANSGARVVENIAGRDYLSLHNNNKLAGGTVYLAKIVVELTSIS